MSDCDEISPFESWGDERIIAWARHRGLDRYMIATIPLMSVAEHLPNEAKVSFLDGTVARYRRDAPTP